MSDPARNVINDPRIAGGVERYHTWPRLTRQQCDAHSMQNMRILLAIWPEAPRHLLIHCLTHDLGELRTGDVPYPVKRESHEVKREFDRMEKDAHLAMCIPWSVPAPISLQPEEGRVFKLAEMIEMWEWGLHERLLGNMFGSVVAQRCYQPALRMIEEATEPKTLMPLGVGELAKKYMARRLAVFNELMEMSHA